MTSAAINADNRNIFPGAAIAGVNGRLRLDRARLAGGGVAAGALAADGARPGGVITFVSNGVVDLDNWLLATGSMYLTEGLTYYLQADGQLSATANDQVVGRALSRTEMLVTLSEIVTPDFVSGDDAVLEALNAHIADTHVHQTRPFTSGKIELTANTDEGSVTGLNLLFTPQHAFLSVSVPVGGLRLTAVQVGFPTADGFSYALLNGVPEGSGYWLHYALIT